MYRSVEQSKIFKVRKDPHRISTKGKNREHGINNELAHQKVYVSALTMPAITQCKPNENLKSCNGKL